MTRGRDDGVRAARLPRMLALAVALTLHGCAEPPLAPEAPKIAHGQVLHPFDIYEYCTPLEAGDRLHFEYAASEPVSFELRYREGGAVLAPVVRDPLYGDSGVYIAPIGRPYCLAWEAGPGGALLNYRITLRR